MESSRITEEKNPHPYLSKAWRVGLAIWMIVFSLVVIGLINRTDDQINDIHKFAEQNRDLIKEVQKVQAKNRVLIKAVNESRKNSCRQTYEGVREVFKPFFPPKPDKAMKARIDAFNNRVDHLKSNCGKQTAVKPGENNDGP